MLDNDTLKKKLTGWLNNTPKLAEDFYLRFLNKELSPDQLAFCLQQVRENSSNSQAVTLLGMMHLLGYGAPYSEADAIDYFELAISQGNTYAMHRRAVMFKLGIGGSIDRERAEDLFRQAGALGNPFVRAHLAVCA